MMDPTVGVEDYMTLTKRSRCYAVTRSVFVSPTAVPEQLHCECHARTRTLFKRHVKVLISEIIL